MKLEELLSAEPGELLKGFEKIRIEYMDNIKTDVVTPSFSQATLNQNNTRFVFYLFNRLEHENEFVVADRKLFSPEKCLEIIFDEANQKKNSFWFYEDTNTSFFLEAMQISNQDEDFVAMLLGDFFSMPPINIYGKPDNFIGLLYAKILHKDKIGWICFDILGPDHLLGVE